MADRELIIRISLPRWKRRRWAIVAFAVAALAGSIVLAGPLMLNSFTKGTALSAMPMNDNFTKLENAIVALQTQVTALKAPTYCGVTLATYDGLAVGGWAGSQAKCRKVNGCDPNTAHMCSSGEILALINQGGSPKGSGWIQTAVAYQQDNGGRYLNDCNGWTRNNGGSNTGATFGFVANVAGFVGCDIPYAIQCCN